MRKSEYGNEGKLNNVGEGWGVGGGGGGGKED